MLQAKSPYKISEWVERYDIRKMINFLNKYLPQDLEEIKVSNIVELNRVLIRNKDIILDNIIKLCPSAYDLISGKSPRSNNDCNNNDNFIELCIKLYEISEWNNLYREIGWEETSEITLIKSDFCTRVQERIKKAWESRLPKNIIRRYTSEESRDVFLFIKGVLSSDNGKDDKTKLSDIDNLEAYIKEKRLDILESLKEKEMIEKDLYNEFKKEENYKSFINFLDEKYSSYITRKEYLRFVKKFLPKDRNSIVEVLSEEKLNDYLFENKDSIIEYSVSKWIISENEVESIPKDKPGFINYFRTARICDLSVVENSTTDKKLSFIIKEDINSISKLKTLVTDGFITLEQHIKLLDLIKNIDSHINLDNLYDFIRIRKWNGETIINMLERIPENTIMLLRKIDASNLSGLIRCVLIDRLAHKDLEIIIDFYNKIVDKDTAYDKFIYIFNKIEKLDKFIEIIKRVNNDFIVSLLDYRIPNLMLKNFFSGIEIGSFIGLYNNIKNDEKKLSNFVSLLDKSRTKTLVSIINTDFNCNIENVLSWSNDMIYLSAFINQIELERCPNFASFKDNFFSCEKECWNLESVFRDLGYLYNKTSAIEFGILIKTFEDKKDLFDVIEKFDYTIILNVIKGNERLWIFKSFRKTTLQDLLRGLRRH